MPADLKLALPGLSGQGALALILDRTAYAGEDEVPGLVAALQSILSADERPAEEVVRDIRAAAHDVDRERPCRCESSLCDHTAKCSRSSDPRFVVDYVSTMCTQCVSNMCATGGSGYITLAA